MTNKNTVNEETVARKHMKPKQNQKGVFKQDMTAGNAVLTLMAVVADMLIVYFMFNTTRFASLSKPAFVIVNLAVLLVLVLINVLAMYAIKTKKVRLFVTAAVLIAAVIGVGAYGSYAAARVNKNIDKITNTTVEESVSTSLVVYNGEDSETITDISQLDGRTVGYANGTHTAEMAKNQIDSKGITVSYQEYQDYSSVILALFSGDIDCAALPTNYHSIFQNESGMTDALEQTASILDFEETVTVTNSAGADKDITKEPFTVLLIGNADGLSDTMILCSVNPISMTVTMSSLARDSYVPISCYGGGYSKLNAAHAVSKQCTIDTIESLVGVDIDYYIDTNFQGVVDIVDALDGIVVNSPIAFVGQSSSTQRGHYTVYVPAGDNVLLNGEQALAFARERHLFASGDFARQEHQQEVIEAIVRKMMRTRDVNTFLNVLEAAGNNIQTNLTVDQMTSFVSYALQKTNRYYDSEHLEKVLQIRTSRVTGYSSNLWDSGSKILLYIYRLWNGSLADTREAINRNIDMTSEITAVTDRLKWSINWDFEPDPISYDLYAEAQIPGDTIPAEYACGDNQYLNEDGACTCNAGFTMDSTGSCVVEATPTPTATPETTATPDAETSCTAAGNVWYNSECMTQETYSINRAIECNNDGKTYDAATDSCKASAQTTVTCWDGSTAASEDACPAKVTCWDGSTAASQDACPASVTCWDGSTAASEDACPAKVTCWDGSTAASQDACPASVTCWDGSTAASQDACPAQVTCSDGTVVHSESECQVQTPTPVTTVTCWDGSTAASEDACPPKIDCGGGYYVTDASNCPVQEDTSSTSAPE